VIKNKPRKIIVAVAPVGRDIKPPSVNPLTPADVAEEIIACADAGAGMVHLHVRDSRGDQTEDITEFSKTLDIIRQSSDIIVQGSTGGLTELTLEERCVALNDSRVEVASLNMGSVNLGEEVYINRLPDIRYWARRMTEANVVPELEIFSAGMIPTYMKLMEEKVLTPPYSINFCLGFQWALPADPETLFFMKTILPQKDVPWGVIHDGMNDLALVATAIGMGASVVRVGFEDSPFYAPGKAAIKNPELVERVVALTQHIGYDVASAEETRAILQLRN